VDILNLPGWYVAGVIEQYNAYIISAEYTTPPNFCGKCSCAANFYQFGTRAMSVADLPIHGKQVTIEASRQRFRCRECGYTFTTDNHLIDDRRRVTKRLIEYIQRESFKRTFTSVAEEIGLDERTIRNVFRDHVRELENTIQFDTPRWLGIDELHLLRRPRCVIGNIHERTIVDMLSNRNKTTVIKRLLAFPDRERVELACMDMWNPYREAVQATLPNARIVADKFHVVRMANQAVETIRKYIRSTLSVKERRALMHDRHVLLKRERDLSDRQRLILDLWRANHPTLARAHELKEELFGIWDAADGREAAERSYETWKGKLGDVAPAFADLTRAIDNWREEVFAYFDTPATNAYTEAINGLTKLANRQGRGYSFDVIRAKMLFAPDNRPETLSSTADFWRPIIREKGVDWFLKFAERRTLPTKHGVDIVIAGHNIEVMTQVSTSDNSSSNVEENQFSTTKSE